MNKIIEKLFGLAQEIIAEKGDLSFFCLALREDAIPSDVWDVLVAAAWIDQARSDSMKYLANKVQRILTKEEILKISAIHILQSEYYLPSMQSPTPMKWEEHNIDLYGIAVKRAYIFVSTDGYFNSLSGKPSDAMSNDPYQKVSSLSFQNK